jgi:acyl-homoserine-lactone acylase
MLALNENDYPEYATLITAFKNWDKRGDADSKGAAIFLLTYEHLKKILQGQDARAITKDEAVASFKYVHDYMQNNFGRTDITLGDLQKLVRGDKEWPLGGFPDLLSPQWTVPYKNGTLKSIGGDGLVMFVRFTKEGLPKIETMNMYGASARPGNKHFDDQVEMYLKQQTKTMTLDKATVYKNAERVYHPE